MVKIEVSAEEAEYLVRLLEWRAKSLKENLKPYERIVCGIMDLGPMTEEHRLRREKMAKNLKTIKGVLPKVKSALTKK